MVEELSYLHTTSKSKVMFYWASKNIYLQASLTYVKNFPKATNELIGNYIGKDKWEVLFDFNLRREQMHGHL